VAFLMGCSSGHLRANGVYQGQGLPNSYMIGSCPLVIANLWDVTDGDIDALTMDVLEKCVLSKSSESKCELSQGLSASRNVCKMRYLNGCASVCYGVPLFLE